MPPAMPNYDLGLLIALCIGLVLIGLLVVAVFGIWLIMRQFAESTREIPQIQREIAFIIRRQYGNIDRDLREIKDLLEKLRPYSGKWPL